MSHLIIEKKNEVYLQITAEPQVYYELRDQFQFEVPGAVFSPSYKNKWWDGKIYLFNITTKQIYIGLLDKIIRFCNHSNYTYEFVNNKYYGSPYEENEFITKEGVRDYVNSITNLPPRDYQIEGIYDCLKNNRKLIVSPTGSGKSLMIYSIVRYYAERNLKILIVVPTTSLVEQIYKDFRDYGFDVSSHCHKIYGGNSKNPKWYYITTEDGNEYRFEGNEYIKLINNTKVLVKDLKETDEIDDRWLSKFDPQ